MKKILLLIFGIFLLAIILLPNFVFARVGVGVATGKIIVEEELNPGETYLLPIFSVINTGDEKSNYAASIEYKQGIEELNPAKEWFSIEPRKFTLDPNNVQNVKVCINIPIKAKPGNYFTFIEAHPVADSETSGASIKIAAASKLYFTIKPSNIFQGVYYKVVSFFVNNAPWTYIILTIFLLTSLIVFFKQKFSFNISVGKK